MFWGKCFRYLNQDSFGLCPCNLLCGFFLRLDVNSIVVGTCSIPCKAMWITPAAATPGPLVFVLFH